MPPCKSPMHSTSSSENIPSAVTPWLRDLDLFLHELVESFFRRAACRRHWCRLERDTCRQACAGSLSSMQASRSLRARPHPRHRAILGDSRPVTYPSASCAYSAIGTSAERFIRIPRKQRPEASLRATAGSSISGPLLPTRYRSCRCMQSGPPPGGLPRASAAPANWRTRARALSHGRASPSRRSRNEKTQLAARRFNPLVYFAGRRGKPPQCRS